MENRERTQSQRLDDLYIEVLEIKAALEGDKDKGIKSPFERIFDYLNGLPCNGHDKRLDILETAQAVNNGVKKERNKLLDRIIKIGLPAGAGGGLIAWLEKIFG